MIRVAVHTAAACGLGLDLNPANFAWGVEHTGHLYYLDDEFYATLSETHVAGALVARIPEEPDVPGSDWRWFGTRIVDTLGISRPFLSWERIFEGVESYPIAERFVEHRTALLDGLREPVLAAAARQRAARKQRINRRRTCVIADVHANLPALEAVLAEAERMGHDDYLFLGDAVGYGPHPAECIARLSALDHITAIKGNHDNAIATGALSIGMNRLAWMCAEWTRARLSASELAWLDGLALEHVGHEWLAVHGAPRDPMRFMAYVYEMTYEDNLADLSARGLSLCFHGHTHVQLAYVQTTGGIVKQHGPSALDIDSRGPRLVNPGSVGQPRDGDPRAAFATWDQVSGRITFHRVPYDVDTTVRDVRQLGLPSELAVRFETGR
jgi:diadenosine tetraphosphatase ApaH/serine/threonine PP2A family protein phosphatase